jgi:EF-hand domain-containing protein 1
VCLLQPGNRYFPKKQTLHYMVGYQQEAGQDPIMCADDRQAVTDTIKAEPTCSVADTTAGATRKSALPTWIENDRKVLRFYGYFQEHVTESPQENSRIRRVVVLYYLEDDTLQISEPQQDNSGLPQVCMFRTLTNLLRNSGACA